MFGRVLLNGALARVNNACTGSMTGGLSNFWLTGLSVNGSDITYGYDNDGLLTQAESMGSESLILYFARLTLLHALMETSHGPLAPPLSARLRPACDPAR